MVSIFNTPPCIPSSPSHTHTHTHSGIASLSLSSSATPFSFALLSAEKSKNNCSLAAPREGEIEGVHYFFKPVDEFQQMIKDDALLEYACFCDNYYGTPKSFIEETVQSGIDILLEIEVQGALQVKRKYPEAIFIFIMPPTFAELESRLIGRNTESDEIISKRLKRAREELLLFKEYDYIVINDNLEDAVLEISAISKVEKLKSERYKTYINDMLK